MKTIYAFTIALFLASLTTTPIQAQTTYSIAIHGGAGGDPGAWSEEYRNQRKASLKSALDKGIALLESGTAGMDVVEHVIRLLEDDELFNAGRGCVLNEQGEHALDASVMDGSNLKCGAVAGVTKTKHPISLARKVMTNTKHVLLSGSGADHFSEVMGLEQAEPSYFRTATQLEKWRHWKDQQDQDLTLLAPFGTDNNEIYFGTVGCVVRDQQGNLAAGTSTGGLLGKKWGRIGDSPIIGAGNYANNDSCAVSGTGVGEEFIRHSVAADVAARMRYGKLSLADAAQQTIAQLPKDCGGIIAIDKDGKISMEFNTPGMSRASAVSNGPPVILLGREE